MRGRVDDLAEPFDRSGDVRGHRKRAARDRSIQGPNGARRLVVADPLACFGVEQGHGAVELAERETVTVGAERERSQCGAVAVHDPERRGAAQQGREQVRASRDRVVEGDAGVGEEQRVVEAFLGQRLGPQALGGLGGGRAARALALGDRDHPGDHGGREQHADAGEQRPKAADGAALALGLALARDLARVEELALELVQLGVVLGGPVERRGEPGAAVELGGIALGVAPLLRGADQVVVKASALGVGLEPAPQPRPLAKQRLVGDLDRALVDGEQARPR